MKELESNSRIDDSLVLFPVFPELDSGLVFPDLR